MLEKKRFRVFATSRIGDAAENLLRKRGYELSLTRSERNGASVYRASQAAGGSSA